MNKQIKGWMFAAFIVGVFVRTFYVYNQAAPFVQDPLPQWILYVGSILGGAGLGIFSATWILVQMKFAEFAIFLAAAMMLGWFRRQIRFPYALYIPLHLMAGFSMACSFLEMIPSAHDAWYVRCFIAAAILAPYSYFILAGMIAFFMFRSFVRGVMELFA